MKNAVIYARYSSHAQNDASIEQQLRECKEYAVKNDLRIVGEYCDHAVTGRYDTRPEFQRMMRDAAKKRFERVLVYKMDRFARNRYDSAIYKARLKKYDIKVFSVKEQIPEGPEGILLEAVLEGSAEYYSANLAQNVVRGMEDNARACKVNNGNLPLGYVKGTDGKYAVEPSEARIVKEIFELYADGMNVKDIITSLNARGLKTSRGVSFNKNSFYTMLHNERYIGVYEWRTIRVENGVPPIISKELFEKVQARMKKVAKAPAAARSEADYILTGKLFCGLCGSPMVGESGTGYNGSTYYYYKCIKNKREHACNKKAVRQKLIEDKVVYSVIEKCLTPEVIDRVVTAALVLQEKESDASVLASLEGNLAETRRLINNVISAIEQGIITPTTKARLEELEERRSLLEAQIEEQKAVKPAYTREQLTFWMERFRGKPDDPGTRETLIKMFVKAVYVYDNHLRIVCNYTGDDNIAISKEDVDNIEHSSDAESFAFDLSESTMGSQVELFSVYITLEALVLIVR